VVQRNLIEVSSVADKNIEMKRKNADGTFDNYYPLTKMENVIGLNSVAQTAAVPVSADGTVCIAWGSRIVGMFIITFRSDGREHKMIISAVGNSFDAEYQLHVLSDYAYGGQKVLSNARLTGSADNATVYLLLDVANRNAGIDIKHINVTWLGASTDVPNLGSPASVGMSSRNNRGRSLFIPGLAVYPSTQQNMSANTWTKVNLASKQRDNLGEFDTSTSRFSPKEFGWYLIMASVGFNDVVSGDKCLIRLYKNGVQDKYLIEGGGLGATAGMTLVGGQLVYAGPPDYFEIYVYSSKASGLSSNINNTNLSIAKVG
jgi:hypothetical protein